MALSSVCVCRVRRKLPIGLASRVRIFPGTKARRRSSGWPACFVCLFACLSARPVSRSLFSLALSFLLAMTVKRERHANAMHFESTGNVPCRRRLALAGTLQTQDVPCVAPPSPPPS